MKELNQRIIKTNGIYLNLWLLTVYPLYVIFGE